MAADKALELLPTLVCETVDDVRNIEKVKRPITTAIMAKQIGLETLIADLVVQACGELLK